MITLDTNGSIVLYKIIENFHEYPLKNQKILLFNEIVCIAYKKNVVKPSPSKVSHEFLSFLQIVQRDIYRLIHPHNGPFHYLMLLHSSHMFIYYSHGTLHLQDYLPKL